MKLSDKEILDYQYRNSLICTRMCRITRCLTQQIYDWTDNKRDRKTNLFLIL